MLKLEKIARTREINVSLRDKEGFFNRTLLFALACALVIHGGALLLFHIAPFKIGYDESIFPPVVVATEFPDPANKVTAHLDEDEPIPPYVVAPLPKQTWPPQMPTHALARQMEYIQQQSVLTNPFLPLENDTRIDDHSIHFSGPRDHAPIKIYVSGSLGDLTLVNQDTYEEELTELTSQSQKVKSAVPRRYIYTVQVEHDSGEVFWYELKHSEEDGELKKLAVDILKSLRFAPVRSLFVSSGEVEIVITPPSRYELPPIEHLF